MPDREKVKTGIFEMLQRNTWKDIDKERHRFQHVLNDALELLKEQEEIELCDRCGRVRLKSKWEGR